MYFFSASRWPSASCESTACAAAHGLDRRFQRLPRQPVLLEQAPGLALVVGQREQEHFGGDELVAALLRFLVGQVEQVVEVARNADLAALPFDLGQAVDRLVQRALQRADIDAGARQQRCGAAVLLVEQGQQQVLRLDELVVVADRQALRIGQRLLELGGEFVETHEPALAACVVKPNIGKATPYFKPLAVL